MRYYESTETRIRQKHLEKGGAPTLKEFCQIYYDEAAASGEGRSSIQAMKESAWLKFGGIVKIEQFNFAGIGALDEIRRDSQPVFRMSEQNPAHRFSI